MASFICHLSDYKDPYQPPLQQPDSSEEAFSVPVTDQITPEAIYEVTCEALEPLPTTIHVRFLPLEHLTYQHFEWLGGSSLPPEPNGEFTRCDIPVRELYGLDTISADQRIVLIQIGTANRCLVISVGKQHRRPEPHDSSFHVRVLEPGRDRFRDPVGILDAWFSNITKAKAAAQIWLDAVLL